MTRVAAIQMASGPNLTANLGEAGRLLDQAASAGAVLAVLPENFAIMGAKETDKLEVMEDDGKGLIQDFLANQAARHGLWLVGGTIPLRCASPGRVRAACPIYDPRGHRVARYDKIHLFDAIVDGGQQEETYTESETIEAGDRAVVVDTPVGRLGIGVCYDLRFPELFRCMLGQGMEVLALPAAFTAVTGKAHWELLVRARAVENLCYVAAACQGGFHVGGRETHGDSMIVDPWGTILARQPRGPGVILGEVERARVADIRRRFPATAHRHFVCAAP